MSLSYPTIQTAVLIGSKVESSGARTGVTLESTYQTTEVTTAFKAFETGGFSKLNLSVLYTMGATETSNSIEIMLEESPDRINWYRIANDSTSGATSTLTAREFTFVGTNAAAATIGIFLDIAYKYMRISVKETGVASNKGTVFVESTLSGK